MNETTTIYVIVKIRWSGASLPVEAWSDEMTADERCDALNDERDPSDIVMGNYTYKYTVKAIELHE